MKTKEDATWLGRTFCQAFRWVATFRLCSSAEWIVFILFRSSASAPQALVQGDRAHAYALPSGPVAQLSQASARCLSHLRQQRLAKQRQVYGVVCPLRLGRAQPLAVASLTYAADIGRTHTKASSYDSNRTLS